MDADSVYYHKPWESLPEYIAGQSLDRSMGLTGSEIRAIRPPLNIVKDPPKYGYPSYQDRQVRVRDLINLDRCYPPPRTEYSGRMSGYQGTTYPVLGSM